MATQLAVFPALPAHRSTVTLELSQYRLRLVWMHRLQSWYLDLLTLEGTPLALGRRLSAGWSPNVGLVLEDGPPGLLFVRAADRFPREAMGKGAKLMYYSQAELQAARDAAVEADDIVVELP